MQERNIWTSVTLVALVGGVVTALLYTDRGRQSLKQFERAMDDFDHSLQQLRGAVQKAGRVAAEGIDVAAESMETRARDGRHALSTLLGRRRQPRLPARNCCA